MAVKPGETYKKIGECVEYQCRGDFSYEGATCGVVATEPPCHVSEIDNTKLYPDCCPKVECP